VVDCGARDRRAQILSILNTFYLLTHYYAEPYRSVLDNMNERLSLLVLLILTIVLPILEQPYDGVGQAALSILIFIPFCWLVWQALWRQYKNFKQLLAKATTDMNPQPRRLADRISPLVQLGSLSMSNVPGLENIFSQYVTSYRADMASKHVTSRVELTTKDAINAEAAVTWTHSADYTHQKDEDPKLINLVQGENVIEIRVKHRLNAEPRVYRVTIRRQPRGTDEVDKITWFGRIANFYREETRKFNDRKENARRIKELEEAEADATNEVKEQLAKGYRFKGAAY